MSCLLDKARAQPCKYQQALAGYMHKKVSLWGAMKFIVQGTMEIH